MPSKTLLRSTEFEERDWIEFLEERRRIIKRHQHSISLPTFGSCSMLKSGNSSHPIGDHDPVVVKRGPGMSNRFDLGSPGFFFGRCRPRQWRKDRTPEHYFGYGLTRSCRWIIFRISFEGSLGYKNRGYHQATEVVVWRAKDTRVISRVVGKPYSFIHAELLTAFRKVVKDARLRLEFLEETEQTLNADEDSLKLVANTMVPITVP